MTALAADSKTVDAIFKKSAETTKALMAEPEFIKMCVNAQASNDPEATKALEALANKRINDSMEQELGALFDAFDTDKNGTLDLKEEGGLMNVFLLKNCAYQKESIKAQVKHSVPMICEQMKVPEVDVEVIVAVVMTNVVVPALSKILDQILASQLARVDEICQEMFKEIDEDGNGNLSKEEFVKHFGSAVEKATEQDNERIRQFSQEMMPFVMTAMQNSDVKNAIQKKKEERSRDDCTCSLM